jgi:alanine racemase
MRACGPSSRPTPTGTGSSAHAGLCAADGFAVLDFAEAQVLRELGWRGPVLMLEGAFCARDLEMCSRLDLWHVVHCEAQIDWLALHKTHAPQRVFLKMNSGMNRLGFTPTALRSAWKRLDSLPQVGEISLMTHFADADADATVESGHGIALPLRRFCLANSAATLRHAATAGVAGDWVRAGILLYGSSPDFPHHDARHWDLWPTMTLRTELIATQSLERGDAVGYGSTYTASGPMRIGVAACGYADGYPRHAPGTAGRGAPVLVEGVRTRLVGRVSMDMVTIDLTPVPHAGPGSEVTLWGRGPHGSVLPIDEVAHAAATVGYELMCALAPRVSVVVESSSA